MQTLSTLEHSNPAHRRTRSPMGGILLSGIAAGLALQLSPVDAEACGCFAPPDPSVPILQAGERIVFYHKDGVITAHIQIQYQGPAQDFGWLLPLPSIPTMRLGVEELFTQLVNQTQPKYRLTRITGDSCQWNNNFGRFAPTAAANEDADAGGGPPEDVLVVQGSIGPYDFAVLRADTKVEMFDWLTSNDYFIPTGTEDVVGPYIHEGAYFLALRLQKGNDTGNIQPVVVEYASDLPMIPIILSSVAANPDMGIQVWVLGESRAIPRNYRHTILNEEHIDWFNAGQNYNDVVIKAIDEADGHHSFITEYAGTTDVMKNLLDFEGRFGNRATLERITEAAAYVSELRNRGFPWSSTLVAILKATFPMPQGVREAGILEDDYYNALDYYLTYHRPQNARLYQGASFDFDAKAVTGLLWDRIVTPTLDAGKIFKDYPKMTRLYTTLSPDEMTKDPVFSFNRDLPDVANVHEATLTYLCSFFQDGPQNTPAILKLPQDGREFYVKNQDTWQKRDLSSVPYSRKIEFLREEGDPEVEVDNVHRITPGDAREGCSCSATEIDGRGVGAAASALAAFGSMVAMAVLGRVTRRRRTKR